MAACGKHHQPPRRPAAKACHRGTGLGNCPSSIPQCQRRLDKPLTGSQVPCIYSDAHSEGIVLQGFFLSRFHPHTSCKVHPKHNFSSATRDHLITCEVQSLQMAYLSASMPQQHKEAFSFSGYDDLFEQYVEYPDSDSYGLSDNSTDRSTSDEWEKYFDLPDSSSGSEAIGKFYSCLIP